MYGDLTRSVPFPDAVLILGAKVSKIFLVFSPKVSKVFGVGGKVPQI